MKKVIHLLNTNSYSGAENVACQIIKMQNRDQVQAMYASPKGKIAEKLNSMDIEFIALNSMSLEEIRKKILSLKPDVIHAHDFRATVIATVATFFSNVKIVSHIHSDFEDMRKITFRSLSLFLTGLKVKKIIWVSEKAYQRYYFRKAVEKKSIVLENTIDCTVIDKYTKKMEEKTTDIVFLGRLEAVKNPLRFLRILKTVLEFNNEIKIKIVGDGNLRGEVEKYIVENGMKDSVEICGFVNEPFKVLADSKLMVMTSINEGLPMAILEAFAMGVPVVSTAVGKIPDIINNENGFCSNNDIEMINFIIAYLNDISMQVTLGDTTKKYFDKHFNYEKYKQQIETIYDEVLQQ